jgi:exodeoxyribonuclease VII large subunit
MEPIGLHQLNTLIKRTLGAHLPGRHRVIAEIVQVNENRSGHCYLELAEKRDGDGAIVAQARATIWSSVYPRLHDAFRQATGKALQPGIKVLVEVEINFHELYGLSLNVKDIDPTFTLGDIERRRQEILRRLKDEGIIDMNRSLPLPLLPKTVAVVSSPTAAGYQDFVEQLRGNARGYAFHVHLFPAAMQGARSAASIIEALDRIYRHVDLFDLVVIIRGGGGQIDLGTLDTYDLAANVAQFPLPVLTGIGHERDETIIDRVARLNLKTPTAVADYLLDAFQSLDAALLDRRARLLSAVERRLGEERRLAAARVTAFKQLSRAHLERRAARLALASQKISRHSKLLVHARLAAIGQLAARLRGTLATRLARSAARLDERAARAREKSREHLRSRAHRLELAATKAAFADPRRALERGFSITRVNGKILRDPAALRPGDRVETELAAAILHSEIKEIETKNE